MWYAWTYDIISISGMATMHSTHFVVRHFTYELCVISILLYHITLQHCTSLYCACIILRRFEDLRIRRETKSKNYNKDGGARKADKTKNARNDKTARLLFIATLQLSPAHEIELSVLSNPIQLCKYSVELTFKLRGRKSIYLSVHIIQE